MNDDEKTCPFCAETIKKAAVVCRYCNRELGGDSGVEMLHTSEPSEDAGLRKEGSGGRSPKEEITYYEDASVTVTNTRAIFSDKTYAMSNVTSVATIKSIDPNFSTGRAILILIGVVIPIGTFSLSKNPFDMAAGSLVALVLWVIAFMTPGTLYWVRVGSSSAEADALSSTDRQYIQRIVDAVNKAIIERG